MMSTDAHLGAMAPGGLFFVYTARGDSGSDIFLKRIDSVAPAVFGVRGPDNERYAAVFRENNTLATLSNPLRPGEHVVVYLTGLGEVSPFAVADSRQQSSSCLSQHFYSFIRI